MDPQVQPEGGYVHQETVWEKVREFFGKFRVAFSVLGALLLFSGLAGGIYLSQQQTQTQQHAAAASDVIGYLDNSTAPAKWCREITGWTCDRSDPVKPLVVHLYAPDPYKAGVTHPIETGLANTTSSDEPAIAAHCGATTGNKSSNPHRFTLHIPDSLKNNRPIAIYVYGIGLDGKTNPLLVGSGTKVSCAPPSISPTPTVSPSKYPSPTGSNIVGDLNGDGVVNIVDNNLLINCYGDKFNKPSCLVGNKADLNRDGVVDGIDYNILLRAMLGE